MAIQQRHTNWQQVRKLWCHIYVFYFVRVLYGKLRSTFHGIFVGIPQHQKGYLVYVPSTIKIISSYNVLFDESFSSALSYTSRPYVEAMAMRPTVTYTPYATSSKEQTGGVITFAQF